MARAGRVVAETLALLGEHIRPGVTTAELDALAEEFIRSQRRRPDLQGLPRLPGRDLRVAERHGRPRHPGRVRARARATSSRSTSASRSTASSPTRRTRSRSARSRAEARAAARGLPGGARGRASSSAAPATASRTSRTRCRQVTEDAGFSVVRSLVGHGVGRSMHEDPQIPNYGEPGRGPVLADGHDVRDRADDQRRRVRRSSCTTTTGRSRPPTARFRPTSSTPWRSPRTGRDPDGSARRARSRFATHDRSLREPCCAVPSRSRYRRCSTGPVSRERQASPMKVRPSVKPMCERCRVIKRHGRTMVICTNPRHKQRQG